MINQPLSDIEPHPEFLDLLFTYKSKVSAVFGDVLGLHEINHIAISSIEHNQLLTFSSTPALEFNLFNTGLWHFDNSYKPQWYQLCTHSSWQTLYTRAHYDELYYLKQLKHRYPLGLSLATKVGDSYRVYSIASHKDCPETQELFAQQHEHFYKIGQYCANALSPLFLHN